MLATSGYIPSTVAARIDQNLGDPTSFYANSSRSSSRPQESRADDPYRRPSTGAIVHRPTAEQSLDRNVPLSNVSQVFRASPIPQYVSHNPVPPFKQPDPPSQYFPASNPHQPRNGSSTYRDPRAAGEAPLFPSTGGGAPFSGLGQAFGLGSSESRPSTTRTADLGHRDASADRRPLSKSFLKESQSPGEPRLVEVREFDPVHAGDSKVQPLLRGIVHAESAADPMLGSNLKKMLIDCMKRIVVVGMENDRLGSANQALEHSNRQLRNKLQEAEDQQKGLDNFHSELIRNKAKADSLENALNDLLRERNDLQADNDRLKEELDRVSDVKSDNDRLLGASQKLFLDNEALAGELEDLQLAREKENISLKAQLAQAQEAAKQTQAKLQGHAEEVQKLKDKVVLVALENERLQQEVQRLADLPLLQQKVDTLGQQNQTLTRDRDDLKLRLQNTEGELGRVKEALRQLGLDLEAENKDKAAADRRIKELEEELKNLKAGLRAKELECDRAKKELEGQEARAAGLKQASQQLEKQLQDARADAQNLSSRSRELENDLRTKDSALLGKDKQIEDSAQRLKQLESDSAFIGATLNTVVAEVAELKEENGKLGEERDALARENLDLQKELDEMIKAGKKQKEESQAATSDLSRQLEALKRDLQALEKDCKDKDLELRKLRSENSQLNQLAAQHEQAKRDLKAAEADKADLDASLRSAAQDLEKLKAAAREQDIKAADLARALQGAQSLLEERERENLGLRKEIEELDGILPEQDKEISDLKQANDLKENQLGEAQNRLKELEANTRDLEGKQREAATANASLERDLAASQESLKKEKQTVQEYFGLTQAPKGDQRLGRKAERRRKQASPEREGIGRPGQRKKRPGEPAEAGQRGPRPERRGASTRARSGPKQRSRP